MNLRVEIVRFMSKRVAHFIIKEGDYTMKPNN